jgi:hypothetical protein
VEEGASMSELISQKTRYWQHNFKYALARESLRYGPLPPIRGCDKEPQCLVSITDFKRINWPGAFVQSFKDDYKFDTRNGVWYDTDAVVKLLRQKQMGMLTPDFSTFSDAHPEICRWNRFRSRMVGFELEEAGVDVIPTLMWWDDESADCAAQGLRAGKTYAVSTIDVVANRQSRKLFSERVKRICAALNPRVLLVYGSTKGIDWGGQRIHAYPNGTYNWTHFARSR